MIKKLRLDSGKALWLINAPDDVIGIFDGFEIKNKLAGKQLAQQLVLFAYDSTDFAKYLPKLADYVEHDTLFWICYPKKSGAIRSDLIHMEPWHMLADAGYRGQTSVSVNDDWTGMRFTNAPVRKPSTYGIPAEQRNDPGIDYVNRAVTLPDDALAALNKYKGLADVFYAMSFTNKKEAVLAINEAKKPETRVKRILKLVEEMKGKNR